MKTADRSDARIALVLGDRDGVAGVKDLATGEQRSVPLRTVLSASFGTRSLRRLLAKRYRPRLAPTAEVATDRVPESPLLR